MSIILGIGAAGFCIYVLFGVTRLFVDPTAFDYPSLDGRIYDDRAIESLVEDVLMDRRNR